MILIIHSLYFVFFKGSCWFSLRFFFKGRKKINRVIYFCYILPLFEMHLFFNIRHLFSIYFFFLIFSGIKEDIRDQAEVSFGSIQPSLSSSLSESSDSDSSIATRLAKIEATSCKPVLRSISFCSDFSTLRSVMPKIKRKKYFK